METLNCETIIAGEAKIIICQIPDDMDVVSAKNNLPQYYFEAFEKLGTNKRKREFITARMALAKLLSGNALISYSNTGKPYLSNGQGYISISHSRHFLALIYHPGKAVGIDIECPTERVLKVSERYLNATEQSYFANNLLKLQLAWSVKEAIYKMNGEAFVDFANSMLIHNFELSATGIINCEHRATGKIYKLNYIVRPEFNMAYSISAQ